MYTYNYGAIGKTIRAKIDNYKQQVRGGAVNSDSFGDVLKTYLNKTDNATKVVSATGNTSPYAENKAITSIDGSTLLYAMQNTDTDSMAGTVLSALGFSSGGSGSASSLKAAADELSMSAEQLVKANASGGDATIITTEFVSDYNKLVTMLTSESTSSAYLYKSALGAALTASADELAAAGITFENGLIAYTGNGTAVPDTFLNTVASSAAMVSSYAGSIISENEENSGISEYYTALMNSMI